MPSPRRRACRRWGPSWRSALDPCNVRPRAGRPEASRDNITCGPSWASPFLGLELVEVVEAELS
eukprot:5779221-Pyramimonas_sp.AAC.1